MATITLRSVKGSPLTNAEVDSNFSNINTELGTKLTGNQTITLSGDATGSGATSIAVTLANSGVVAGTYTKVTVDAKGRVTTGASLASGDLPTYSGSLTSSQVTTALGFTPYNSTNPSGYITSSASITGNAATATTLQTARSINGTSFNGSANITTANWGTARTLTIGATGKSVDGSGNVSWTLAEIGALSAGIAQQGGKSYVTHDFNTYPALYDVTFVNPTGSSNLPTGMSAVMSYRFIMGAGDTTTRGFDLVGAAESSGNLYMRERSIGTWSRILHSNNFNSYAPTLSGTGATGTWGISITGNAASATAPTFSGDSTSKDNITTRTDSGFWQSDTGTTAEGWPLNDNGWQHLISCTHSNDSNYYAMQIAAGFYSQNWYFRNTNGSGTTGWSTMLHSGNYTSYVAPVGGSWYGSGLPGSRWYGYSVGGGEFVLGNGLPNAGQVGVLIDGCYVAGENNGFWSLASDNTWGSRRGFYWDGTNLNFTTNSPTVVFSTARASQITAGGSTNTDANLGVQGTSHLTGTIHYGGTVGNVNSWSSISTSSGGTHTFSGSRFIFDRYGYGSQPLIDMQSGSITLGQPTYAGSGITVNNTSADGRGINLYGGSPTSPTYGLFFAQTGNFGTYGSVYADWATYFTMNSTAGRGWIFRQVDSPINVAAISNSGEMTLRSHFEQGNNIARPNVSWSASSTSTGMVIFYLPGTTSNYGMVHMVFDIYEYNGNAVSTVIVGGHNWSTSWYNTSANVIGQCGKEVRLGVKDGRFCVVFGAAGSTWEYGTIVLRKIHNGGYYDNVMNMTGDWSATQTTTESFTNITGDLRALRTPASFNAGGAITQAGNQVLHAGNYNSYAPTLGGTGASGTWGINITGSASSLNFGGGYTAQMGDWGLRNTTPYGWIQFGPANSSWCHIYGSQAFYFNQDLYTNGNLQLHAANYNSYAPTLTGGGASGTWSINITGNAGTLQGYQWASAGKDIRGSDIYADSWLRNYNSGTGLYNQATANHWYSDGQYWNVGYSGTTGIRLRNGHAGTILGYLYAETSGNFGLLHNGGGWAVQVYPGGGGNLHGSWAIGGNTPLTSANYTNYSPPYSGGTLTGTWYFTGNGNTGSSSSPALQAYSTGGNGAYMSFHRGGYYAVNMGLDSDNVFRIGGWSASANRLQMDMSGNLTMAGLVRAGTNFYADQNYGYGLVGVYASTRYQGVFAMGDSYKLPADGTSAGNLYGIAWSYPSAGGVAGNLDSHGMLVLINGGFGSCMSYSIVAAGNVTAYSDERLKTNWRQMPENFVERLAQVKSGIYDRIDGEKITQVGVGAQSFQKLLPEVITKAKDEMGTLSVSYGNAAMASAVELAKEIVAIKRELEALKARLH